MFFFGYQCLFCTWYLIRLLQTIFRWTLQSSDFLGRQFFSSHPLATSDRFGAYFSSSLDHRNTVQFSARDNRVHAVILADYPSFSAYKRNPIGMSDHCTLLPYPSLNYTVTGRVCSHENFSMLIGLVGPIFALRNGLLYCEHSTDYSDFSHGICRYIDGLRPIRQISVHLN